MHIITSLFEWLSDKQNCIVVTHLWQYLRSSDVPEFGGKLNDVIGTGCNIQEGDNIKMQEFERQVYIKVWYKYFDLYLKKMCFI